LAFIEQDSGRISKNRVMDYQKNFSLLQNSSKKKQLTKTNFYLNQLLPQYDQVIQKKENHWATPKEFLIKGFGDCEDYVIIKYFSLIKLGFNEKKLFISVVKETYSGGDHMVLSYFRRKGSSPLILDNLSFKILTLKQRKDLMADIFINSTGIYKLKNNKLFKIGNYSNQYRDLIKRIKKELKSF